VGRHQRGCCRGLSSAPVPSSACQFARPSANNLTVPRKVFGKDKVTMFEMNKHLARHLT
jgi:hypothetical protein